MGQKKQINKIPRRQFLSWLVPVLGSSAIIFSFKSIYSGSINNLLLNINNQLSIKSTKSKRRKKVREKWYSEFLVLNTSTNVVHYPSESLFTFTDRISSRHIKYFETNVWKAQIGDPKHLIKQKSGVIIEKMVLKELSLPLTNTKLNSSVDSLAIAFSNKYFQNNLHNWRLYDLLIQLIALNTSMNNNEKWEKFCKALELIEIKNLNPPKRNNWIKTQSEFEKRVNFIVSSREKYIQRIEKRIG